MEGGWGQEVYIIMFVTPVWTQSMTVWDSEEGGGEYAGLLKYGKFVLLIGLFALASSLGTFLAEAARV